MESEAESKIQAKKQAKTGVEGKERAPGVVLFLAQEIIKCEEGKLTRKKIAALQKMREREN
jgi:hypothetical protein